jgi:hypothetical protein
MSAADAEGTQAKEDAPSTTNNEWSDELNAMIRDTMVPAPAPKQMETKLLLVIIHKNH